VSASVVNHQGRCSEVTEFDPDIIVLMPCGFDVDHTMKELWRIERVEE